MMCAIQFCAWAYLGLEGTSHLTGEAQELIQQFRIHNRLDTSFWGRPLQSQRGQGDHKQWIEDNSKWKSIENDQDKKEDNDSDDDDKIEDDNMEGTKKRRIDK